MKRSGTSTILGALLFVPPFAAAESGGVPPRCASDAHASAVNGIPTPRDNRDPHADIADVINLLKGLSVEDPAFVGRVEDADEYFVEGDALWSDLDGRVVFLGLTAKNRNVLGVYVASTYGTSRRPLLGPHSGFGLAGRGTPEQPFPAAMLGLDAGQTFGWYLETSRGDVFYSEEERNPGGWDHLFSYRIGPVSTWVRYPDGEVAELVLEDVHVLAWEDLPWDGVMLGDEDYDDMLYLVGRVTTIASVPAPGSEINAMAEGRFAAVCQTSR